MKPTPATYDFLLVSRGNQEPILYRFQDEKQFQLNTAFFHTPHVFNAPA